MSHVLHTILDAAPAYSCKQACRHTQRLRQGANAHGSLYKRNVPPWSAGLATRSVVGFVDAKVVLLFETAKLFEEKE